MIPDSHYSPFVLSRITPAFHSGDVSKLTTLLDNLSHAQFRTAGYMLGEFLLPTLDADRFWSFSKALIDYNSKAFLVIVLKSFIEMSKSRTVSIEDEGFRYFCKDFTPIDAQKTAQTLLPVLQDVDEVMTLFSIVGINELSERIPYCAKVNTLPCAYVLFTSLRYVEHDHDLLVRITLFLIKKGDSLSFNLASLIKVFFGLEEIKNTFSLQLKPFQLARIENSYAAFCDAMRF